MPQPPRLLVALSLLGLAPATVHAQQAPGQTLVAQYSAVATTRVVERPARPERPAGIVRGRVVV